MSELFSVVSGYEENGSIFTSIVAANWVDESNNVIWWPDEKISGVNKVDMLMKNTRPNKNFQSYKFRKMRFKGKDYQSCKQFLKTYNTDSEQSDQSFEQSAIHQSTLKRKQSRSPSPIRKRHRSSSPVNSSPIRKRHRSPSPNNSTMSQDDTPDIQIERGRSLLKSVSGSPRSHSSPAKSRGASIFADKIKNASSNSQPNASITKSKNDLDSKDMMWKILKAIGKMQQDIAEIKTKIEVIPKPSTRLTLAEQMSDIEEFNRNETQLEEEGKEALVQKLVKIGGQNDGELVRNMMGAMMTNALMCNFNFRGTNTLKVPEEARKRAFKDTLLYGAVRDAVIQTCPTATLKSVEDTMKDYLKNAPKRSSYKRKSAM